jgi:hypothetical protein
MGASRASAAPETPSAGAAAVANKVVGDACSVDTKYPMPFDVTLEKWFAEHPVEAGKMIRMDPVFQTPRCIVLAATNKGGLIDLYYHTAGPGTSRHASGDVVRSSASQRR